MPFQPGKQDLQSWFYSLFLSHCRLKTISPSLQAAIVFTFPTSADYDQHVHQCSLTMTCTVLYSSSNFSITTLLHDRHSIWNAIWLLKEYTKLQWLIWNHFCSSENLRIIKETRGEKVLVQISRDLSKCK